MKSKPILHLSINLVGIFALVLTSILVPPEVSYAAPRAVLEQGTLTAEKLQATPATVAEKFNLNASAHYVVFNADGFAPNTIIVKVGDTVTWHNATNESYTLRSGVPNLVDGNSVTQTVTPTVPSTVTPTDTTAPTAVVPTAVVPTAVPTTVPTAIPTATSNGTEVPTSVPTTAPTTASTTAPTTIPTAVPTVRPSPNPTPQPTNALFLPLITNQSDRIATLRSSTSAISQKVGADVDTNVDFEQLLAPSDDFDYTFTTVGSHPYYLAEENQLLGYIIVEERGTALTRTSPSDGEGDVAVTRETIVEFDTPIEGASVIAANFRASFGGATLEARLQHSADGKRVTLFYNEPLPASARIQVTIDGDNINDADGQQVDADGDGEPGGRVRIAFDTLSLTVIPGTSVCGRVFASELVQVEASSVSVNDPLEGATITVDGQEDTLRTTTDEMGNFCLDPAPVGRFFVHIDGRTATNGVPSGAYYPFVGKAWESTIGQQINVGNIYLPLIQPGTLQAVSAGEDTQITFAPGVADEFPELAGTEILVPADSLFADDGSQGGQVGISPVPPDRLPGQLPPGLNFPIVITVQTDGATNFDVPAPACFPNLPDTETGEVLAAGEKSALWSFNHDTGRFEVVGPMTVSDDGTLVCTDPGVGIEAPGWHGVQPGTTGRGGPLNPPPPSPPPPGCSADQRVCRPREGWNPNEHFNGCGAANFPEWVTEFANDASGCSFYAACNAHDIGYSTCMKSKSESDIQFLLDMREACSCHTSGSVSHDLCLELANGYFVAVASTDTGEEAYRNAQEQACDYQCPETNGVRRSSLNNSSPEIGLHYYTVYRLRDGEIIQRGIAGSNGIAFPSNLILGANEQYQILILQAETLDEGYINVTTPGAGGSFEIPTIYIADPFGWDLDDDGLAEIGELVMGTDPFNDDSDEDGINDGTEVQQGTNPLDGIIVQTGIIATADTPGTAVDVCATDDLIAVADSDAGVALFNVFNGMNPTIINQVDTPGNAQAVACGSGWVAVADGQSGLAVIDVSDPSNAQLTQQVDVDGTVQAVAVAGNVAYVGNGTDRILAIRMIDGAILGDLELFEVIQDIFIVEDVIHVLTTGILFTLTFVQDGLDILGQTNAPSIVGALADRLRIFATKNNVYTIHAFGYNTFDVSTPSTPVLITRGQTNQAGWKHIVTNGSGLGIVAQGPGTLATGHDISLYDVSDLSNTDSFVTTFETPSVAKAVTLYNGQAYVADSNAGMQVINYLTADTHGITPTITIATNFDPGVAEESAPLRISADTNDDVQVRNVEFYIDGNRVATDGNYPFEVWTTTPALESQESFTLQAKVTDTGGNAAWTIEQTVNLMPDTTPPRVIVNTPKYCGNAPSDMLTPLSATFSEVMDATTINATNIQLFESGEDQLTGTDDDQPVATTLTFDADSNIVTMTVESPLSAGFYRAVFSAGISDIAGNSIKDGEYGWTFNIGMVVWDGGGDGISWRDPLNWTNDQVPGEGAFVVIDCAGTRPIVYRQDESTITGLQSTRPFEIRSGALTINQASILTDFTQIGGTLAGAGDVTVTDVLRWTGGTMSGSGKIIAAETLLLDGNQKTLSGRTLDNAGTATLSQGFLHIIENGVFNNLAGATLNDSDEGGGIRGIGGNNSTFNNLGIYTKSGDTDTSFTSFAGAFNNSGTVNFEAGELRLHDGTNTGIISTTTGTTLGFYGDYVFDAGSTLTGDGDIVSHNGSTVNFNGTYAITGDLHIPNSGGEVNFTSGNDITLPNLTMGSVGVLTGTDDVTVTGVLTWAGGTMSGSGKTVVAGTLLIDDRGTGTLSGRTLDNAGTATWLKGQLNIMDDAVFNNLAGATFNDRLESSYPLRYPFGDSGTFNNLGIYTKSTDTETSFLLEFNNSGTVNVQSGRLNLKSGTNTGIINTSDDTTVDINNTDMDDPFENQADGRITGTGTLDVSTGTFTNSGTVAPSVMRVP